MRLISDTGRLQRTYGFDPVRQLLAPGIRMDEPKMVTPLIAETDAGRFLLGREQETGNLRAHGVPDAELRLFEQYVSFDNMVHGSPAAAALPDAVAALAGDGPVTVEGDLPYGRYLQLADAFGPRLTVDAPPAGHDAPVVVHRIPVRDVLARFRAHREAAVPVALRVLESRPHLIDLKDELDPGTDTRFTSLDALLGELGATAVLCAAPPNLGELTALPAYEGARVLWVRGADELHLITPAAHHEAGGRPAGRYRGAVDAVRDLAGTGALAIDEGWQDVAFAQALLSAGVPLVAAGRALSGWREGRDGEDLASALIIAQASRYCIEGALADAERWLDDGRTPTELDVYRRYLDLVHAYREEYAVPFSIRPFFANCHAADRTIYPALPTEHPLTAATKSLKLDSGLKIVVGGVVMTTSDVARTLVRSDEGREAYATFTTIVRDDVIAGLRPGMDGTRVHRDCMDRILDHRARLEALGLMPPGIDLHAEYGKRNVGHLMGKQESFTNEFRPGDDYRLSVGSIGAVEIQWPYRDHSIASEDLWYVGRDRSYVTSA